MSTIALLHYMLFSDELKDAAVRPYHPIYAAYVEWTSLPYAPARQWKCIRRLQARAALYCKQPHLAPNTTSRVRSRELLCFSFFFFNHQYSLLKPNYYYAGQALIARTAFQVPTMCIDPKSSTVESPKIATVVHHDNAPPTSEVYRDGVNSTKACSLALDHSSKW